MCGRMGRIGTFCLGHCMEDAPLANERDGSEEPNPHGQHTRCIYKAVVMPDTVTIVNAPWYESVIFSEIGNGDTEHAGSVVATYTLLDSHPRFTLVRGCIHHRMVMHFAESAMQPFPPGNEFVVIQDDEAPVDQDA
jgi:hypothetical protein